MVLMLEMLLLLLLLLLGMMGLVVVERVPHLRAAQPGVTEGLIGCEPVPRTDLKEAQDEVQSTLGNVAPDLLGEVEVPLHNLSVQLVEHTVVEWQRAAEQHVSNDTEGPDVDLPAVLLLLDHFWREVEVGSADRVGAGQAARVVPRHLRKPKVANLDVRVACLSLQQNVFWLKISVHDSPRVDVGAALEQVIAGEFRFMFGVEPQFLNSFVEFTPRANRKHKSKSMLFGTYIEQGDQTSVLPQDLQYFDLLGDTSPRRVVAHSVGDILHGQFRRAYKPAIFHFGVLVSSAGPEYVGKFPLREGFIFNHVSRFE